MMLFWGTLTGTTWRCFLCTKPVIVSCISGHLKIAIYWGCTWMQMCVHEVKKWSALSCCIVGLRGFCGISAFVGRMSLFHATSLGTHSARATSNWEIRKGLSTGSYCRSAPPISLTSYLRRLSMVGLSTHTHVRNDAHLVGRKRLRCWKTALKLWQFN